MHTHVAVLHVAVHVLADARPWLSQCVLPCTGAGVVEQEEDDEDEAMAEAEQIDQLREAGHVY